MIVSVNQPAYLPWLGYFHRIAASDLHVVLDHVQFEKNSFVNRNRVRTAVGSAWLTVPVRTSGRFGELPIDELEIDGARDWARKHRRTIQQAYAGAPHYEEHVSRLDEVYARSWARLLPLCAELTGWLSVELGVRTETVSSRELAPAGRKDALVLDICRRVGATTYLSGPLGRDYLREELFAEAGIRVVYDDFHHPTYPQRYEPFLPAMAAIDLLFNSGPAASAVLAAGVTGAAA